MMKNENGKAYTGVLIAIAVDSQELFKNIVREFLTNVRFTTAAEWTKGTCTWWYLVVPGTTTTGGTNYYQALYTCT